MNTTGKIVVAAAAGLAVGAVLGIIFAPNKGSETRRKISEQGKKVTEGIKTKIDKLNFIKHYKDEKVNERMEEFA